MNGAIPSYGFQYARFNQVTTLRTPNANVAGPSYLSMFPTANTWYSIKIVYNNGSMYLYVNDVLKISNEGLENITAVNTQNTYLGISSWSGSYAQKEEFKNLKIVRTLDYSNIINKPLLGALALKNSVDLSTSDITGVLPVANVNTSHSSSASSGQIEYANILNKPAFAALALKNAVDLASTDVTGLLPGTKIDLGSSINLGNYTAPAGITTELGGTTPIINLETNFHASNKNTIYPGLGFRLDGRGTGAFAFFTRPANSPTETQIINIASDGILDLYSTSENALRVAGGVNLSKYLNFATIVSNPSFTTRSPGTKVVMYPAVSSNAVDYAIGMESANMWFSIPANNNSNGFKWYGGTTVISQLLGDGTALFFSMTDATTTNNGSFRIAGGLSVAKTIVANAMQVIDTISSKVLTLNLGAGNKPNAITVNAPSTATAGNAIISMNNASSSCQWGIYHAGQADGNVHVVKSLYSSHPNLTTLSSITATLPSLTTTGDITINGSYLNIPNTGFSQINLGNLYIRCTPSHSNGDLHFFDTITNHRFIGWYSSDLSLRLCPIGGAGKVSTESQIDFGFNSITTSIIQSNFVGNVLKVKNRHSGGYSTIQFENNDSTVSGFIGIGNTATSPPYQNTMYIKAPSGGLYLDGQGLLTRPVATTIWDNVSYPATGVVAQFSKTFTTTRSIQMYTGSVSLWCGSDQFGVDAILRVDGQPIKTIYLFWRYQGQVIRFPLHAISSGLVPGSHTFTLTWSGSNVSFDAQRLQCKCSFRILLPVLNH
ncbi:hypothetical protein DFS34DRAFT_175477 [Phlyctochytrium arcticum]|nr:hypothetical protein DFS34DRAFT_175477 [Phlyctochytrium arcticum]